MRRETCIITCTIIAGICLGLVTSSMLGLITSSMLGLATTEPSGVGVTSVSYAFVYKSFKEAYENADLVIVGTVTKVEYYLKPDSEQEIETSLGTIIPSTPITFSWLKVDSLIKGDNVIETVLVMQFGGKGYLDIPVFIPEDPPLIVGEKVLLFLIKNPFTIKYESEEHVYYGPFGRFEIIDNRVFSAMYGLPQNVLGRSVMSRDSAKNLLASTDYSQINGVPLDIFIQLLNDQES